MSNTVITNYTDLNGPSTKADSSVVVIVNKDGSLSVDQNLLGTLMGSDGSQAAGISVVRVGHEGKPDDATDTESEDEKIPHVTLSVDSYYDEPNSIIKYDSGAEMLQSLRIETRENSLLGFQNDHCYTPLTSPDPGAPQRSNSFTGFDEPILEITQTPPPKPVPQSKKITVLEHQIIPKGRKLLLNPSQSPILKGHEVLKQPLQAHKSKQVEEHSSENTESSSISSGDSIPDRDSDSDYKDDRTSSLRSVRKSKLKPRILKAQTAKAPKLDTKVTARLKAGKDAVKKELKQKIQHKNVLPRKSTDAEIVAPSPSTQPQTPEIGKVVPKQTPKSLKKEKKTPAHVTALLSDMTSLFSSPDVIRRVSTDLKTPGKPDKEQPQRRKMSLLKPQDDVQKSSAKQKVVKGYDPIPQLDDASLAQILEDTTGISSTIPKVQQIVASNSMSSPGLAGPLSPTLDLLAGLQPEEEGLTEDLLMHVAQLVESSENLQEVIDKQVLGKVDAGVAKTQTQFQQGQILGQTPKAKPAVPQKSPIEIVRRDGRVITLPPIEAPATRSSKRKNQPETPGTTDVIAAQLATLQQPTPPTPPEPQVIPVTKQYPKKVAPKKLDMVLSAQEPVADKISAEVSQESWNSEDDPYRLWCICKQPHNNRFMICCDSCEDWFHGKCVNITKPMGQQMEEQGIEWRCPNCIKNRKHGHKSQKQMLPTQGPRRSDSLEGLTSPTGRDASPKTGCIVCKRPARASSIYCSDACILKHAQDSLGSQGSPTKGADPANPLDKPKPDSRVIVYERKSGRLLAGPNAPTAENLKQWLQRNPTFEVVRPGTLHTIKPNLIKKKPLIDPREPKKVQTTLNFERVPRKSTEANPYIKTPEEGREKVMRKSAEQNPFIRTPEGREKVVRKSAEQNPFIKTPESREKAMARMVQSPREDTPSQSQTPQAKTPTMLRQGLPPQYQDTPRPSTSTATPAAKPTSEPKKPARPVQRSSYDRAPAATPSTSRRKDAPEPKKKMESAEPIRENVRKALQEQMAIRMNETSGSKFTKEEIKQFAIDTEFELHELFKDVGMKYKVKYRSLIFNIKDRKNLSLWKKICDRSLTPKQLVRMSPEELASQELAQWREEESKHQLELIKKSELDLLAASKTYVLKTHKGEEVMQTKESVSAELDPNMAVEDVVTALNETVSEDTNADTSKHETPSKSESSRSKSSGRKRGRDDDHSKKSSRSSKRESDRKSRSSRRRSESKEKEERSTRRSDRQSRRDSSPPKDKKSDSKEKDRDRSRHRSRSRGRSKRGKSREHSRSVSKGRDRSRSRHRSSSKEDTKRRRSTRNKQSSSTEEKAATLTRARSQDMPNKPKNESPDSDSVERPKSAMLKEVHPEYDPHEPMITSAFSEEDLRKSGADSYEEMGDYGVDYEDPTKDFTIDTSIVLPPMEFSTKHDKSEAESDQEPSSTVDNAALTVWNGCINMVDVARFYVAAHEASGCAADVEEDLSAELDIVGRINPETVWEYIGKMKRASNKDIIMLRLQAANDEEKMQYIALYSYLSTRNRLGVVKVSNTSTVKDIYIVPLSANTALPSVLLPLDGPGLGENKTHLLLAIVIRQRKRPAPAVISKDLGPLTPPKMARTLRKRSYTPPIVTKAALPLPATYTSPALSTSVKDKIAASIAAGADMDEPYSPGSSTSSGSAGAGAGAGAAPTASAGAGAVAAAGTGTVLRSKMEELNRQIAEQKQQILKMAQADSSVDGEDEAYSPSRPMTPPTAQATAPTPNPLADIALPSNLHEILATIKQRETGGDIPPP